MSWASVDGTEHPARSHQPHERAHSAHNRKQYNSCLDHIAKPSVFRRVSPRPDSGACGSIYEKQPRQRLPAVRGASPREARNSVSQPGSEASTQGKVGGYQEQGRNSKRSCVRPRPLSTLRFYIPRIGHAPEARSAAYVDQMAAAQPGEWRHEGQAPRRAVAMSNVRVAMGVCAGPSPAVYSGGLRLAISCHSCLICCRHVGYRLRHHE